MGKGGGGGGLRILPHKSWNVWNRDNIEKVKKDEAKFEAEEKERLRKQSKADAEHRLKVRGTFLLLLGLFF